MRFQNKLRAGFAAILFQLFITFAFLSALADKPTNADRIQTEPIRLTDEGREWATQTLANLTLEEKIGQMIQVRYFVDYKNVGSDEYKHAHDELQKYHIGSMVFGMHFNSSGPERISPLDAAKTANQLQRDSKLPLLLAADFERGLASRLKDVPAFPWPMAFGAADNPVEVERFAAVTARQSRAIGVQWALAPVADVDSNPINPVINTRSFGEDPDQVANLVTAFIRGAHANGLLVTAKHFPGNGDTSVDSHRKVATIDGDLAHLERIEFPPFKRAIGAGVDSIMLAHARVPALEPDPDKIATISSKVVQKVLRNQFAFKGIIVTDALEMKGMTKLYDPKEGSPTARAAVDAIKAGCDVIMLPTDLDGTFHAIVNAVRSGEILEAQIDDSVLKILLMKAAVGLNKSRLVDLDQVSVLVSKTEDMEFAQHIADEAITLVRNNRKILPLHRIPSPTSKSISSVNGLNTNQHLVAIVLGEALASTDGLALEEALRVRRSDAAVFHFDNRTEKTVPPKLLQAVQEADEVVVAVYAVHSAVRHIVVDGKVLTSFGPLGQSGHLLEKVLEIAPTKTVVVVLGNPYLIETFPEIQTYVCTYSQPSTSEISVVKALFGEIQNHARLPVTFPGIASLGFSIAWPTEPSDLSAEKIHR